LEVFPLIRRRPRNGLETAGNLNTTGVRSVKKIILIFQMPNKLTGGAIQHILWGVGGSLLAVHTVKEIFLLREQQVSNF